MIAEAGCPAPTASRAASISRRSVAAVLVARLQAAERKIDPLARDLAIGRREALGQHQLVRQREGRCRSGPGAVSRRDIP